MWKKKIEVIEWEIGKYMDFSGQEFEGLFASWNWNKQVNFLSIEWVALHNCTECQSETFIDVISHYDQVLNSATI